MVRLDLRLSERTYPVLIGEEAVAEVPALIDSSARVAAIVTDDRVGPLWAAPLARSLREAGLKAPVLQVAGGESAKSWAGLRRVIGFLESSRVDRKGVVIALGGGTVGDLAGFAAAIWLRGVSCIQAPTTLLAMVDSSLGGKTAIDTRKTKNGVGAFWQPDAVVADLNHLKTLPNEEYMAAFAEIVKYGVSLDGEFFRLIEERSQDLVARSVEALESVVSRSLQTKAVVVTADERETGLRAVLNYGHTVGHALEVASGYRLPHGRAVAAGMRAAAWISTELGRCSSQVAGSQDQLLGLFGLPGSVPELAPDEVLSAIARDKKSVGGEVEWVLLSAMGRAEVGCRVPGAVVEEAVRRLLAGTL